uniref:Uncharacterized protein n=1 Tax=Cacopsylla melanoneura TaxID=428564 RepID=A0A8D8TEK3_9HEMI
MDGNHMMNLLRQTNGNSKIDIDNRVDGNINENKITSNDKAKEPLNKHEIEKNNANQGELVDGNILYNLLKQDHFVKTEKDIKHNNDEEQQIKGEDLFNILNPNIETKINNKNQMNFDKFYQKLFHEFSKDNQGVIDALHTKKDQHKVLWNDQNVEIPNIDFNDRQTNNIKAENVNSDRQSNEAPEE